MANLTQLTLTQTLVEVLEKLPSSPHKPALEKAAKAIFALLDDYPRRAHLVDMDAALSPLGKSQALEALRQSFKKLIAEGVDTYRQARNTYITALEAAVKPNPPSETAQLLGATNFNALWNNPPKGEMGRRFEALVKHALEHADRPLMFHLAGPTVKALMSLGDTADQMLYAEALYRLRRGLAGPEKAAAVDALEAAEEYLPKLDETLAAALHFGAQDFKIPVPDLKRLRVGVGG